MSKMNKLLGALFLVCVASNSYAGAIYTSQVAFDAAVAAATNVWSEDFESFPLGSSPDPLAIGGGLAEVVDGNHSQIWDHTPGGDKAWLQVGGTVANATIRGLGGTNLGLFALSFEFANQLTGSWVFDGTSGTQASGSYVAGGDQVRNFIGWVGTGDLLNSVHFSATNGIVLDNIAAYSSSVPEPSMLGLLALSLFCLGRQRRRKLV